MGSGYASLQLRRESRDGPSNLRVILLKVHAIALNVQRESVQLGKNQNNCLNKIEVMPLS